MGRQLTNKAVILFFAAVALGCYWDWPSALAQSGLLSAGKKAFDEGKTDKAIELLTKAVKSNELTNTEIAEALYQRGIAYKRQKKTAAAIADLNGALFIKSLPPKERQQALKARADIFSSMGQTQRAAADLDKAAKSASKVNNSASKISKPVDSIPVEKKVTKVQNKSGKQIPDTSQKASGFETKAITTAAKSKETSQETQPGTGSFSGVTSFFKNLISPSSKSETQKQSENVSNKIRLAGDTKKSWDSATSWSFQTNISQNNLKTAALPADKSASQSSRQSTADTATGAKKTTAPKPSETKKKPAKAQPAKTKAASKTEVSRTGAKQVSNDADIKKNLKPVQKVPSRTVEPRVLQVDKTAGRYRLRLASAGNVDDAIAAWKQLSVDHRDLLRGRNGEIQQVETSGSGTMYNVRIGPFSDEAQSVRLCNELRRRGVGCDPSNP